jgi:single stranded DNA-binding protein
MASIAQFTVMGNLGKDPVYTAGTEPSKGWADLSIAVEVYEGKKDGKPVYKTDWYDVRVFGQQAEYVGKNAKKGNTVVVIGDMAKNKKDNVVYTNYRALQVRVVRTERGTGSTGESGSEQTESSEAPAADAAVATPQAARTAPAARTPASSPTAAKTPPATMSVADDEDLPF